MNISLDLITTIEFQTTVYQDFLRIKEFFYKHQDLLNFKFKEFPDHNDFTFSLNNVDISVIDAVCKSLEKIMNEKICPIFLENILKNDKNYFLCLKIIKYWPEE